MAHLLGIRPWEWALLTVEQEESIISWVDQYMEEIERSNRK